MKDVYSTMTLVFVGHVLGGLSTLPQRVSGCVRRTIRALRSSGRCANNECRAADTSHTWSAFARSAQLGDAFLLRADVLGYRPEKLELTVEPRRLTIVGRRKQLDRRSLGETIYLNGCPDLMLRTVQLPLEIDPERTTAMLKGGILEVVIAKAVSPGNPKSVGNTQWIT
jgi:HSP20 family molecular chaperone IbpA